MKDGYGREINYLRLSVTDLCNLRCRYCMPEKGVDKLEHASILSLEDLYAVSEAACSLGVNKIRVTGGEPLVRKNVLWLIGKLSSLPLEKLGVTTNGIALRQYAQPLKEAGVDNINVSLDTLDAGTYEFLTRGGRLEDAVNGIRRASELGFSIKLNAVYMKNVNDKALVDFLKFAEEIGARFRYIELMPFSSQLEFYKHFGGLTTSLFDDYPDIRKLNVSDGTSKLYELDGSSFGLITPMSDKFCRDCNRIRVTSDGRLLSCLHSSVSVDLKPYVKDKAALKEIMAEAVAQKPKEHRLVYGSYQTEQMQNIGG